jgi:hypothetical protein
MCARIVGICAKRASVRAVPNKNAQHQHSEEVSVKWSFSRRLGGDVSHTRQGVVNTPQGLI